MVRLKESLLAPLHPSQQLFQFLMVRLKVMPNPKSQHCHYQISIPYGAIKSLYVYEVRFRHASFQFLMVRLKGLQRTINKKIIQISIPYGAIKRHIKLPIIIIGLRFQFLMVRLKV